MSQPAPDPHPAPRRGFKLIFPYLLVAAVLTFFGCVTAALPPEIVAVPNIDAFIPAWRPVFKGIDIAYGQKLAPDPQVIYAARIDLKEPSVEFFVSPSNGDRPADTDGLKTSTFLKKYKCQLAVNGSPFSPVAEREGTPQDIIGLSVSRGDIYSKPRMDHSALTITKDNHAAIAAPPVDVSHVYNGVGGFGRLLRGGKILGENDARHPRTAVGISADGRYMYLFVIDGRQPNYSVGATTAETAQWALRLGAGDALNLDGGGSTVLVMADLAGNPVVVNSPIHNNIPGNERVTANSLGIYAKPLK